MAPVATSNDKVAELILQFTGDDLSAGYASWKLVFAICSALPADSKPDDADTVMRLMYPDAWKRIESVKGQQKVVTLEFDQEAVSEFAQGQIKMGFKRWHLSETRRLERKVRLRDRVRGIPQ